jgi:phosphatidylglycerophosphate synthase
MLFMTIAALNHRFGSWVAAHTPCWITPNGISWSRLAAGVLMLPAIAVSPTLTFLIYTYGCLSDWWDGQVARHRGLANDPYGKRLDELTDKGLMLLVLPVVVYQGTVPLGGLAFWSMAFVLGRDFVVTVLRWYDKEWAKTLPSLPLAKAKTGFLMVGSGLLILAGPLLALGAPLVAVAAVCALVSGVQYGWSFFRRAR